MAERKEKGLLNDLIHMAFPFVNAAIWKEKRPGNLLLDFTLAA
jgi:hypothetical protein